MENILPSTNVPKDTDREFFNNVLNGTATPNYIDDYIKYCLDNNRLEKLESFFMVESIVGGGFSGRWCEMENGGKMYVPEISAQYTPIEQQRLSAIANKLAALLKQQQQPNEPTTNKLITDYEQLPPELQQRVDNDLRRYEIVLKGQMEINPDKLNEFFIDELQKATNTITKIILAYDKEKRYYDRADGCYYNKPDGVTQLMLDGCYFPIADVSRLYVSTKECVQLIKRYQQQRQITTQSTTAKPQQKRFVFEAAYTEKQSTEFYRKLIDKHYLSPDTNLQMWLYVFGLTELESEFVPIKWLKTNQSLAKLISELFADVNPNDLWEIATQCFTVKGIKPNKGTLANSISRQNNWKNTPKDCEPIIEMVKSVKP
ncbi:MAG: hypothetical protein IKN94_12895 [Salinivirgaceae bacterium]|nr:hypothetical protein [Salinivirgaceae bacterium]